MNPIPHLRSFDFNLKTQQLDQQDSHCSMISASTRILGLIWQLFPTCDHAHKLDLLITCRSGVNSPTLIGVRAVVTPGYNCEQRAPLSASAAFSNKFDTFKVTFMYIEPRT